MTDTPPDAPSPNRLRRSGRIILLDQENRVLLIRLVLPRRTGDYQFWATPGGEIEGAESPLETAHRELGEELGLDLPLEGPVHHANGTFEFWAETVDNEDDFYLARWPGGEITLDGVDEAERRALKEVRWWSADAIDAAPDPVYPPDLSDVVRRLATAPAGAAEEPQNVPADEAEPGPGGLPPLPLAPIADAPPSAGGEAQSVTRSRTRDARLSGVAGGADRSAPRQVGEHRVDAVAEQLG